MSNELFDQHIDRLMALIEGRLSGDDAAALEAEMAASPALAAEYAWLQQVCGVLEAEGRERAAALPPVDVLDGVLDAVSRSAPLQPAAPPQPTRNPNRWLQAAGLAAAASLAIGAWVWYGPAGPEAGPEPKVATHTPDPADNGHPALSTPLPEAAGSDPAAATEPLAPDAGGGVETLEPGGDAFEATPPPDAGAITMEAILEARRAIADNRSRRSELLQLASLSAAEAERIVESGASIEAQVGVADALDADEAGRIILAAVGKYPESGALRMQLAQRSASAPEPAPAVLEKQVADLQAAAPDNALGYFWQGVLALRGGRVDDALSWFAEARERDRADVYSLQHAAFDREALIASGMSEEAASLLSALTAGADQAQFLSGLRDEMLQFIDQFANQGDASTAQALAESLARLGEQVSSSAVQTTELEAGLEMQRQAMEVLTQLLGETGSAEQVAALTQDALNLEQAFESLHFLLQELDNIFTGALTQSGWDQISQLILTNGDLNLFTILGSGEYPELDSLLGLNR